MTFLNVCVNNFWNLQKINGETMGLSNRVIASNIDKCL
jgi:hypothetical protein